MSFPQSPQAPSAPKPGTLASERHATMHAFAGDGCGGCNGFELQGRK